MSWLIAAISFLLTVNLEIKETVFKDRSTKGAPVSLIVRVVSTESNSLIKSIKEST